MLPVALALGASLSWGVCDYLAGLRARSVGALVVVLVSQAIGVAVLAVALAVAWPGTPTGREAGLALLGGVVGSVGLFALYRAMSIGAMGVVTPISGTAAAIPVTVGLARGERPTSAQAVGMAIAFVGVVLAAREPGTARAVGRSGLAAGAGLALVAAAGGGVFLTLMDAAAGDSGVLWPVTFAKLGELAVFTLAALVTRPSLAIGRDGLGVLAVVALLDTAGILLFARAATEDLVSLVAVLASLYPVVTVALAHSLLRERVGLLQRAGTAAALGGVALIAAG